MACTNQYVLACHCVLTVSLSSLEDYPRKLDDSFFETKYILLPRINVEIWFVGMLTDVSQICTKGKTNRQNIPGVTTIPQQERVVVLEGREVTFLSLSFLCVNARRW